MSRPSQPTPRPFAPAFAPAFAPICKSARPRPRWVIPPTLREAIREPRTTFVDRPPPVVLLAVLVLLSGLVHVAIVNALRGVRGPERRLARVDNVRVAVIETEPVPPKAIEAPAPLPVVRPSRPSRVLAAAPSHRSALPPPSVAPPVQPDPPPPPGPETAVPDLAPALLPGVALSATTVAGTTSVAHGGSPAGRPFGESAGPGSGKPYNAKEFAEAYALTEPPRFLDNVSPEKVRTFYPEAARRDRFEGAVGVKLLLDDDGSVVRVTPTNDPGYGLAASAIKLARLYRFTPARVNGRAVATEIKFTVDFQLED